MEGKMRNYVSLRHVGTIEVNVKYINMNFIHNNRYMDLTNYILKQFQLPVYPTNKSTRGVMSLDRLEFSLVRNDQTTCIYFHVNPRQEPCCEHMLMPIKPGN